MKGTPRSIHWRGWTYPSHRALCRTLKLNASTLHTRLEWLPPDDIRLSERYLIARRAPKRPLPPLAGTRSPMWVRTWFGWWKV